MIVVVHNHIRPQHNKEHGRLISASQGSAFVIDCAAVEKSSSVGIALLLALMRDAAVAGKKLTISNLPEDMLGIARVCELQEILPLQS